LIYLDEQKYMGISTTVLFGEHDSIDFRQLQLDVARADIPNVDFSDRFMALDYDFQPESFRYAPLVPVTAFTDGDYFRFTREAGEYYCFQVLLNELNPQWFQACFAYIEQHGYRIDRSFDLEYYPEHYTVQLQSDGFHFPDQTISMLFRKEED
jgi:hypothetical protein